MQMDVQIGGRAKTLDEGDSAGVGCAPFQPRENLLGEPLLFVPNLTELVFELRLDVSRNYIELFH